jgi:orotidine-5'-phosphate decarboxylase
MLNDPTLSNAMNPVDTPIYVAIDTDNWEQAQTWIKEIAPTGCGIKLGLQFFNQFGPQGIATIMDEVNNNAHQVPLFLDLKYHDIPQTVYGAVFAACALNPAYLNVHASGGLAMMQQAKQATKDYAQKSGNPAPRLLAVTILTSLDTEALQEVGYQDDLKDQVLRLAALTQKAGLDGIVCSAHEIDAVKELCGPDFKLMVPGIRPADAALNDQKRVMTPQEARAKGAQHLVIGRPITGSANPAAAATAILNSL